MWLRESQRVQRYSRVSHFCDCLPAKLFVMYVFVTNLSEATISATCIASKKSSPETSSIRYAIPCQLLSITTRNAALALGLGSDRLRTFFQTHKLFFFLKKKKKKHSLNGKLLSKNKHTRKNIEDVLGQSKVKYLSM